MKVIEAAQNPAKPFEDAIWSRKQYLDTARGHYLSALAGLSGGKHEQTIISHSSNSSFLSEDYGFNQAAEAERVSTLGVQGQVETFSEMGVQMQLPNGVLKACEEDLESVKMHLNKTLARKTKSQLTEMFCKLGNFEKDTDMDDSVVSKALRTAQSEPDDIKESPSKTLVECSSLYQMVESLKAELEILKNEHTELKEVDAGAEFAAQNLNSKPLKSKPENRGCLEKNDKPRQISEEVSQDKDEVNNLKIKGKGLKREHNAAKVSAKVEKKPRVVLDTDEPRDQAKGFSEGHYPAYVSTSESSARIMISEDELESSSQQVEKSARLEREYLADKAGVEDDKCVGTSEFSIRNFVFAARNRDISLNWPFSQKNLQLCMKHGVQEVLPPFQTMDSLEECSMKRCLAEKSLHSEESTLDKKAPMLKNHLPGTTQELDHSWDQELDQSWDQELNHSWDQELAECYRDSASLPIGGERDLAFKTVATANSHSEVESVSTSNLPLSEVSDEQAAASAADNKLKSSASQLYNKKCKVAVKIRVNSKRNTPEDITSACTAPSEAISSKICPVCENFSSSSNTTLNAHIDQCLSSQSPPIWMKSSKLNKPRIRSRKMRLMTDICATAPCCTLEDLDRRNGTHWATNVDSPLEDSDVPVERENLISSRYINNVDDGSVYIDSSGRKIRILSKLNDTPSSLSKAREDVRPKKQSRNGKRGKFNSPNRKKRLTKNLKYLKVTHQRKRFSSMKVKGRFTEACGAEEAVCEAEDGHLEQHQPVSFVKELKAQEQNRPGVAGAANRWISFKISNLLQKSNSEANTKLSRYEIQAEKNPLIGYDEVGSAQVEPRGTPAKMHLNFPKRSLPSVQRNSRTSVICAAEVDQRSGGSVREGGPLLRSAARRNRKICQVSVKVGAEDMSKYSKESTPKYSDSNVVPALPPEREVESRPNTLQNADISFPSSRQLLCRYHDSPSEGMRSHNSKTNLVSLNASCVQANSENLGSSLETSCNCSGHKEAEVRSDTSKESGARIGHLKSSRIAESSTVKGKKALKHDQDVAIDSNRSDELADDTSDNCCVRSAVKSAQNDREFVAPVSSSSLAVGVNETSASAALDLELEKDADISCQFKRLKQGSLLRSEARGNLSEPGLNDHEMLYGSIAGVERSELKTRDYILSFRHGSLFPEVDPIPIPGPPGSELPSFSDMGSEDTHRNSLSTSSAQLSRDGDDVVDGDLSESPLSATSTLSNLDNKKEYLSASLLVSNDVYPGWLGASSGPLPTVSTISPRFASAAPDIESVTCVNSSEKGMINLGGGRATLIHDNQQCCCSDEEKITHSSMKGFRQTSSTGFSRGKHVYSSSSYHKLETAHQHITSPETTVEAAGPSPSNGDYSSAGPAPILRLMGKDLMISNRMDSDISRSQTAINVSMNKLVEKNWEPQSSRGPTFMGPLLHGPDPHLLPLQHFDVGSSNVMHRIGSHNQSLGGVYIDQGMHASFSVLGTTHLQR